MKIIGYILAYVFLTIESRGEYSFSYSWDSRAQNWKITDFQNSGSALDVIIPEMNQGKPVVSILTGVFDGNNSIESVQVSDQIKTIENSAFQASRNLREVSFGKGLVRIGWGAFSSCTKLENVNFSNESSLERIEDAVFVQNWQLQNITLPDGLLHIGTSAFSQSGLTRIRIPGSVTEIGYNPFRDCRDLANISVEINNPSYAVIGGCLYDQQNLSLVTFPIGSSKQDYELAFPFKKIGVGAFSGSKLKSVSLAEGLEEIGGSAFSSSQQMETLNLPKSLSAIGSNAFSGCGSLERIEFKGSLRSLGEGAFRRCENLSNVIFNEGFQSIGKDAFAQTRLTQMMFFGGAPDVGESSFQDISEEARIFVPPKKINTFGGEDSNWNGFLVQAGLKINSHPSPVSATVLEEVVFEIDSTSELPITYQWRKNGINIQGAITSQFSIPRLTADDTGSYSCVVSNEFGELVSDVVELMPSQLPQKISFDLVDRISIDFSELLINASADSSLPLSFSSSDPSVAAISGGRISLVGVGSTIITASQEGNNIYLPANSVERNLVVFRKMEAPRLDLKMLYESAPDKTVSVDATPIEGITDEYSYQWFFNGSPIPESSGGFLPSRVIYGTTESEGTWKVEVTNLLGKAEHSFEYRIRVDTDGDGFSNAYEDLILGTNPEKADSDGDGLDDFSETETHKTDPLNSDTDGDGFLDGFEIANSSAPLIATSKPHLALKIAFSDINNLPALTFTASPIIGGLITIEQSFDLTTWTPIVFFNGEGTPYEAAITRPLEEKSAYRLKVVDQTQE